MKTTALCQRCSHELHGRQLMDSMAIMRDGRIAGFVCNDCLTPAECAEMIINESTTQVGIASDGRIMARAKRESG
jgi:hypothetical protein